MDGEHIFSASIVLAMVCIAFPTNTSNTNAMRAGLELLRGMAQRGNSHMAARYELLEHLRSVVMPGYAVPSPLAQPLTAFPNVIQPAASTIFPTPMTADLVAAQAAMPAPGFTPSPMPSEAVDASGGDETDMATEMDGSAMGAEVPLFSMVDGGQLGEIFYDENMSIGTDFMLWEEGFANPAFDAGYDLTRWTQGEMETESSHQGSL